MTTAKKKPVKKAPARGLKPARAARKIAPVAPRYSEHYERALKEYERAFAHLQKREFAEALKIFELVLSSFPDESELCDRSRQYVSICREKLGTRGAKNESTGSHFHMGVYHMNRAEMDSAVKEFEKALQKEPQNDMFHYGLASAFALSGDKGKAIKALTEAVRFNENNRVYAQNDPDFDRIRDEHDFIQLVEPEEARAR